MNDQELDYGPSFQEDILKALAADKDLFAAAKPVLRDMDFDHVPARFVYEVMSRHWDKYGVLPSCETFHDEMSVAVDESLSGMEGAPFTEIEDTDVEEIARVVDTVSAGLCSPSDRDTQYWRDRLKGFIAAARLSAIPGEELSALQQVEEVQKVNEALSGLDAAAGARMVHGEDEDLFSDDGGDGRERIGTGVWGIDRRTAGGGLTKGELGLVVAPSGFGKTTVMINFGANMAMTGYYTLFVSLEMPYKDIFKRYTAIMGNFDATYLHLKTGQWPKDALERARFVASKKSPFYGKFTILDGTGEVFSVPMVESAISKWREDLLKSGVPEDRIAAVFVDYLGKMTANGLPGINKNSGVYDQERKIMDAFDGVSTRQNVILWTATQTNREGFGRAQQTMKNISNSIGAVFPTYLAIGLGSPKDASDAEPQYEFEVEKRNANALTRCDRKVVITIMKSRNSQTEGQFFTVYQGPTLRLWTNSQQAQTAMEIASRMSMDELYATLRPPRDAT